MKKPPECNQEALFCIATSSYSFVKGITVMNCNKYTQSLSVTQPYSVGSLIEWVKTLKIKARLKLLMRHLVDRYGKDGLIFPSIRTLARELCVSMSTVHRWLNELTAMNLVCRKARYRSDGGRTSNYYELVCDRGISIPAEHEQQSNAHVIHAPLPENVACKQEVRKGKPYKINVEKMTNAEYAVSQYRIAVKQKWIPSGSRERLNWFSSWTKCVRQWREGKVKNPAALMTKIVKDEIYHKFPAEQDEIKAMKILRMLVQNGLLNP
jgi:DNA-binding MarR family transcriptional regulator